MKKKTKLQDIEHADKRERAIHEAAHAVFTVEAGIPIKRMSILVGRCGKNPVGFSQGHCLVLYNLSTQKNTKVEAEKAVRGMLAGGIAELLFLENGVSSLQNGGSSSDFQEARNICSAFSLDAEMIIREMFIDVQLKRDIIIGMANELLKKGRMDERDILKTYHKFAEKEEQVEKEISQ